jgi:hypothetical protein
MIEPHARTFFDTFVEAFRSFDGATVAQRYLAPYLAFHTPTSIQVFTSQAEIASYFQRVLDGYHAQGCRSCRYKDLVTHPLGEGCVLATVTWELLAEDLSVISAWRESYNLCLVDDHLMVFTSIDHPQAP